MAVFELEQRYLPLIECQHVWQPWGVAGRYTLDEEGNVSEAPTCKNSTQHAHSWGGYAPYALRRRFSRTEDMADDLDQLKATKREQEVQGASRSHILANDFQDIMLAGDDPISQSGSRPAVEAQGGTCLLSERPHEKGADMVFPYQSTAFPSEDSSPCYFSDADGNCCSNESALFSGEANRVSFANEASSRPQKEWRRRRAVGRKQAGTIIGSCTSAMMAKEEEGGAWRSEITTLMVQNVPHDLSREELLAEVERTGFPAGEGGYNFCHLPCVFKTGKNKGFVFLNFTSQAVAKCFAKQWHNSRSLLQRNLHRALTVKVASVQGIEACERFAQSKKMQKVKTGNYKPLVVAAASQAVTETDAIVPVSC